ncbi:MAG TPA: hypothetical protein VLQ91_21270, partial [Draconibacterium sp.]|nr:hypothetical protein [Draconibacterium sp.]
KIQITCIIKNKEDRLILRAGNLEIRKFCLHTCFCAPNPPESPFEIDNRTPKKTLFKGGRALNKIPVTSILHLNPN